MNARSIPNFLAINIYIFLLRQAISSLLAFSAFFFFFGGGGGSVAFALHARSVSKLAGSPPPNR